MSERRVVIAGGGAAGFFAAIACAEASPATRVTILEKGPQFLAKVRISGGGRCNVTHACYDPRDLVGHYPRGGSALRGPFERFQPRDTVAWFEGRGVRLKTEEDGRMFPATDSSQTIISCLVEAARAAGVEMIPNCGVERAARKGGREFELTLSGGRSLDCDNLMLATGGCRTVHVGDLATALGHTVEPPVPSLFSFHLRDSWFAELSGISLGCVEVAVPSARLREAGPIVITHQGVSGPAVLRLSAWGARRLHSVGYHFTLRINWIPAVEVERLVVEMEARRSSHSAKLIVNTPLAGLPARLWERLVLQSGITRDTRWAALSRAAQHQLVQQLRSTEVLATGKSLNKDEFVTCGGVRLNEVNFKTMESRICPGLYFGGELLDIDGLTGGFNFQAAWTTGWIAGQAMAGTMDTPRVPPLRQK
jgi:predicted Rossmann fold flavoprotein